MCPVKWEVWLHASQQGQLLECAAGDKDSKEAKSSQSSSDQEALA